MGYTITDEKDKTRHWAYAIDEGYGNNELIVGIGRKQVTYKLPISESAREPQAVANIAQPGEPNRSHSEDDSCPAAHDQASGCRAVMTPKLIPQLCAHLTCSTSA